MGIVKLLQAIRNLTKLGSIKSIEQAYKLAQREVGERFNQIKKQIDDAFNQGKKEQTLDKRTKDIKKIDDSVVAEGIETLADTKSGKSIMDQIQESKTKIEDASSKITNAQKEIDEMYRPKTDEEIAEKFNKESDLMKRLEEKVKNLTNVENISTGLTRTIAREILSKRGIDIPKGRDALEIFKEKFGQDVLIDVNNLAEELIEMDRMGKKPKSLTQIIEQEGFFDVKMPKEPPQGYTPDELAEIQKEIEQEDILLKFDPTGRKSNSMGGINRINFADGPKDPKKKALINTIKKIPKVGKIVGGVVEVINFIKTLDPIEAMKEVNKVIARKGPYKNITDKESEKIFNDTQDHIFEREPKPTEFDIIDDVDEAYGVTPDMKKKLDNNLLDDEEIESAKQLAPQMVERLQIKAKYPGIDDELVDKILIDDNPQRKAELLATLDEAFRMMEKGKSTDEIIDTFKNQNRTKQASGTGPEGLSEITSLYEKIRMNNVQKQKDASDNKQMRFRKLLASNKFPELNTFLEAELNEDDEKVELDVRTNFAVGGSPFTEQQIAQRKNQSYLDYLARQGVGQSGTTTGPAPTFNPFTGTSTTPPASGGSQPGTGSPGTGGGGGTTSPNLGNNPSSPGTFISNLSPGSGGGGSTGGGSTGSSGGGTSGGGSNVYTGAGNYPPGMGTNTGGGSTGGGSTGGGSGLTPNTGHSNVGGGGFGGTGSIVGGGGGSTGGTGTQAIEAYKNYLKNQSGGAPVSFESFRKGTPYEGQLTFTTDNYDELQNIKNAVSGGYQSDGTYDRTMVNNLFPDTGDLGSEAANDAANNAAKGYVDKDGNPASAFSAKGYEAYLEQHKNMKPNHGAERGDPLSYADWQYSYGRHMKPDESATADDGFEDQSKDMGATADDGFEDQSYTDAQGNKSISKDLYDQAKYDFFKDQGKIPEDASLDEFKSGKFAGATYSPRDSSLNLAFRDHMMGKYGTSTPLSSNSETAYTQVGGGKDFAEITSLPETSNFAKQISNTKDPKSVLKTANEFATKHGKTITAASYLLDKVVPGSGQLIRIAQSLNKGYNIYTDSKDAAIDDGLNQVPGYTGSMDLREENKTGGRVGKAVGGPLDLAARQKQSQLDFLARQPGAQPAQPQPAQPQPAVNPQPAQPQPAVNPQPPATSTAGMSIPSANSPTLGYNITGYEAGYLGGGMEDSRNIALGNLMDLGVDVSKYRKMTATDTSGPKFQGLSLNEIFAMDENTAKETLGFDPSVEGSNPEFEKFMQSEFERIGPTPVGPGGPAGIKTEFMNEDELAQILNRAIPYYMRTARDLGENYTLEEMLAMSDDELAMIDDRYSKKMGYGKYAKTPGNIYNTNSGNLAPVKTTKVKMQDIINQQGGMGTGPGNSINRNSSGYMKGGRVGFKYGSDRYGQSKKVSSAMNVDYNDPFKKLMSNDSGRFIKSTSSLARYAKNLNKLKNSKQAKAALRKSLLVENEKTRKEALQRLNLLKKLYSGGKSV